MSRETVDVDLPASPPREEILRLLRAKKDAGRLIGTDLSGLDLSGFDLSGLDLSRADLSRTKLVGAKMSKTVLFEANLAGSELLNADLRGAELNQCNAVATGFGGANLTDASLFQADLQGASFTHGVLRGADLRAANLEQARMRETDLTGTNLSAAQLRGAELSKSKVAGALFVDADLREARLRGLSGYTEANWIGADIVGVDFCGAYLLRRTVMDQNYLHEFRSQSPFNTMIYWVWWATSDCGRSFLRWGLWVAFLAVVFALLFEFVALDFGEHRTFLSSFYYSVITLTTLGYGDVVPASAAAQLLAMIEVTAGYVMLGGLLSIFSSKMARRAD